MQWGPSTAISDITPAAGWRILGECDEHAMNQKLRLVCDSPSSHCSHLFSDGGPKDKIVRLPDWCGPNPFARVAEASISADQSLPPTLAAKLWKRDGQVPSVHALQLDTEFHKIDSAGVEPIRFAIQAATIPMEHDIDTHVTVNERSRRLVSRRYDDIVSRSMDSIREGIVNHGNNDVDHVDNAIEDLEDIGHAARTSFKKGVKKATEAIKVDAKKAVETIKVDMKKAAETIKADAKKVAKKAEKVVKNIDFGPIIFDRNVTLVGVTINCPPLLSLGLKMTLNPVIRANGTIGVVVVGTLKPLHVADFSTLTKLSASVTGFLAVTADVAAVWDTGRTPLYEMGLPGMDFPGILSLGPKLKISAQTKLTVDLSVGARIGINYHVKNALIYHPQRPGRRSSVESFGLKNSPLHLSATPYVEGFGQAEAKVPIISISFGASVFEKDLAVAVILESTLLVKIQLEVDGKTRAITRRELTGIDSDKRDISVIRRTMNNDVTRTIDQHDVQGRIPSKTLAVVEPSKASPALQRRAGLSPGPQPTAGGRAPPTGMDSSKGTAFRGCVAINLQLEIYAAPEVPELANTKYSFFKHSWQLWERCFGNIRDLDKLWHKLTSWRRIFRRGFLGPVHRLRCLSVSISAAEALISDNSNVQASITRPLKANL
ncbi:hypothetical protein APHAL10511_005396 [Amanita phalloides]|nr:hypothetical protein APHAL10511_005396 [Amanita phalloides]